MNHAGDDILTDNASWSFAGQTVKHFAPHARRSIPFYQEGHDLILKVTDFFLSDGSVCYDLGCSTGILLGQLSRRHQAKSVRLIGVDNEPEMIEQAAINCPAVPSITWVTSDLLDVEFEPADVIIAYYTLQFVKPKFRQMVFNRIYHALNWGGAFILFEKVRAADARFQDMMTSLYTDYKLDQGYTGDEIVNKARSLKGVLEPFSTNGNLDLLKRAGFLDIMTIMKYVSFEGLLAIK